MAALLWDSRRRCAARTAEARPGAPLLGLAPSHVRGTRPEARARAAIVRVRVPSFLARPSARNFLAAREPAAAPEIQRHPTATISAKSALPRAARTSKNHEAPLPPYPSTRGHFCRRHGCFPHHNQSSADYYRCRGRRPFAGACAEIIATSPAVCREHLSHCLISTQAGTYGRAPCANYRHVWRALHLRL